MTAESMPPTIRSEDPLMQCPDGKWLTSLIGLGGGGFVHKFSNTLVYKAGKVSRREVDLMEAAGDVAMKVVTRVLKVHTWNGVEETHVNGVVMELGRKFNHLKMHPATRRDVAIQMFQLIDVLHNKCGIVHGDIKPENFVWGVDNQLKLIDFGFARFVEETDEDWPANSYLTPIYARKERTKCASHRHRCRPPTVFDDYYALAVTLWEMFTRTIPVTDQFSGGKDIKRSDLRKVDDKLIQWWIEKVFRMARRNII
jgi:serine/threonine protein kinase